MSKIIKTLNKTLTILDALEEGDAFDYIHGCFDGWDNVEKVIDDSMIATKSWED